MSLRRIAALLGGKRSMREMDDREFIDHLYRTLLMREPDEGGRQHWLAQLAKGRDRLDLMGSFVEGPEFSGFRKALRFAPPGHFYSPHPSHEAIEAHHRFDWSRGPLP